MWSSFRLLSGAIYRYPRPLANIRDNTAFSSEHRSARRCFVAWYTKTETPTTISTEKRDWYANRVAITHLPYRSGWFTRRQPAAKNTAGHGEMRVNSQRHEITCRTSGHETRRLVRVLFTFSVSPTFLICFDVFSAPSPRLVRKSKTFFLRNSI